MKRMFPRPAKTRIGGNCRKTLRVFPTKGLRSAARIICPSMTDKFHTGSPRGIFSHAHVARENDLISLPPAGGKLCEAFLTRCPDPQKRGSGLFFGAGRTRGGERRPPLRRVTRGTVKQRFADFPSRGRGRTPPLRSVARSAVGRADVGIGPYGYIARGAGRAESPSHGFAVPVPFRQGDRGDGGTDCHSQCAHWLRNDRVFQGVRGKAGRRGYKRCGKTGRRGRRPLRTI